MSADISVKKVEAVTGLPEFAPGFSFFVPYIRYQVREVLAIGGEACLATDNKGENGLFIFDSFERIGTVYAKSRKIFDYFYKTHPDSYIFSELELELPHETYDIFTIKAEDIPSEHTFTHRVEITKKSDLKGIKDFLMEEHPYMNPKWVETAYANGDRFFVVKVGEWIAGLGWASLVDGVGRMNDIYVLQRYRRMGICGDILFARFMWLKSKGAKWTFSEVLRSNTTMANTALREGMKVVGQIYEYGHPPE